MNKEKYLYLNNNQGKPLGGEINMKIKIEFTKEERNAVIETLELSKEVESDSTNCRGSFGEFDYDSQDNKIEIDLVPDMFIGYLKIISNLIKPFKQYIEFLYSCLSKWFDDAEVTKGLSDIKKDIRRFVIIQKEGTDQNKEEFENLNNKINDYFKSIPEDLQMELIEYKRSLEEEVE